MLEASKNIQKNYIKLLRTYQHQGIGFLLERESALLADEMGMGKTVQAAFAAQILVDSNKCLRILIICPASLSYNWEVELKHWTPKLSVRRIAGNFEDRKAHFHLPFRIWITSYDQIRYDIEFFYKEPPFDLIILDEAQRIKNPNSAVALACRQLQRKRAWALTGTPLENKPADLLSIFAFLKPGLLHAALNRKQLHKRMAPFFLRRQKKEVLDELPPIIFQDIKLEMDEIQRDAYDDELIIARESIHKVGNKYRTADLLAQITKLKQICNFEPFSKESCKFNALLSMLSELIDSESKILVFSQYVETLKLMMSKLSNLPVDIYFGGLSGEKRKEIVDIFEKSDGPRLLLISLKAGGVGLNLGSASVVILFDRWWNPAVEDQAIQRAHRYGRSKPLHVIRFIITDSIEERIEQILKRKKDIFRGYIDEAEIADIPPLTRDDLMRIIGTEPIQM